MIHRTPILMAFIAVALGMGISRAIHFEPLGAIVPTFLLGTALVVGWRRRQCVALLALFALVFAGAALAGQRLKTVRPSLPAACDDRGDVWRVRVDAPIERVQEPDSDSLARRTTLVLVAQRCRHQWLPGSGRVRVHLTGDAEVRRGDTLDVRLRLWPVMPARNPAGVDPLARASQLGVTAWGAVVSPHVVVQRSSTWLGAIDAARSREARRIEDRLKSDTSAIAKALAMGDRGAIQPAMRQRWSDAGMAHLLAISGLHIACITAVLFWLARRAVQWLPGAGERYSCRRVAAGLAIVGAVAFCLWTGSSASAVRATVMAVATLTGIALGRPGVALNSLGIAGFLILVWSPESLTDIGFLLSMVAVAALLALPRGSATAKRRSRIRRMVTGAFIVSAVATLATAPILAHHFGRLSLVAPITNIVAVPWATGITTPLALVFALVGGLSDWTDLGVAVLLELSIQALDGLAAVAAKLPGAAVEVPPPSIIGLVTYYSGMVSALWVWRCRQHAWIPAVACLLFCADVASRVHKRSGDGMLHVLHPYVGQGDAAVVLLPKGGVALFDAGGAFKENGWDPGEAVLVPLFKRLDIRTIDMAIVSHAHPDHARGFLAVASRFRIRELWWTGADRDDPIIKTLLQRVRDSGGKVFLVAKAPSKFVKEGVTFEFLHPRPSQSEHGDLTFAALNTNDNSAVLRLQMGARSTLLPGDIGVQAEAVIRKDLLPTDILKAPHHGSDTSSSAGLLDALQPKLVVISCGHQNRFGLPHASVLQRYKAAGIEVLRTDQDGQISLRTDGSTWWVQTLRGRAFSLPSAP